MAIHIAIVEENWFNLLEALDDGEYDKPVCEGCGEEDCICQEVEDEREEQVIRREIGQ